MALLGLVTNLLLLLLLLVARYNLADQPDRVGRTAFWLSAFVALTSIVMGGISTFLIGSICLFCLATYILSFLTFGFTFAAQPHNPLPSLTEDILEVGRNQKWILILFIAVPVAAYLGNKILLDAKGFESINYMVDSAVSGWKAAPVANFTENGLISEPKSGSSVMTIVEFADFGCPHCRFAVQPLHAFADSHPDVKMIFKVFPLDGTCNPEPAMNKGDGLRCTVAQAVFCAEKTSRRGWAAHEWAYAHQEDIFAGQKSGDPMQTMANELQLDWNNLQTCMTSSETADYIRSMAQEGANANIRGTPSIFVNGKSLSYGQTLPVLESIYKTIRGQD
jgi:protein-disulfide isomerase